MPKNGWNEYKKLILDAHEENKKRLDKIDHSIVELKIAVAELKTRNKIISTVYGAVGGIITAVLYLGVKLFM